MLKPQGAAITNHDMDPPVIHPQLTISLDHCNSALPPQGRCTATGTGPRPPCGGVSPSPPSNGAGEPFAPFQTALTAITSPPDWTPAPAAPHHQRGCQLRPCGVVACWSTTPCHWTGGRAAPRHTAMQAPATPPYHSGGAGVAGYLPLLTSRQHSTWAPSLLQVTHHCPGQSPPPGNSPLTSPS